MDIVRKNMMTIEFYTGYCGSDLCKELPHAGIGNRRWPRTKFISRLNQFKCPNCGWVSNYPEEFIKGWKEKWGIT